MCPCYLLEIQLGSFIVFVFKFRCSSNFADFVNLFLRMWSVNKVLKVKIIFKKKMSSVKCHYWPHSSIPSPPKSNIRSCHAFTHAPKGFLCLLLGLNCATISNHFHLPQAHTILSPSYLSQQVAWAPRLTNTEVFGHKLYATFSLSFYFLSLVKKSSFFLPRGIESRCFAQSCSSFSPTYKTDQ